MGQLAFGATNKAMPLAAIVMVRNQQKLCQPSRPQWPRLAGDLLLMDLALVRGSLFNPRYS